MEPASRWNSLGEEDVTNAVLPKFEPIGRWQCPEDTEHRPRSWHCDARPQYMGGLLALLFFFLLFWRVLLVVDLKYLHSARKKRYRGVLAQVRVRGSRY